MHKYVYDTNALLTNPHLLDLEGQKIIPYVVLKELDKLKMGRSDSAFQAREAVRKIKNIENSVLFDDKYENSDAVNNNDDVIIACAESHKATIVTGDLIVQIKAKARGIEYLDLDLNKNEDNDYTGIKELYLDLTNDEDAGILARLYGQRNNFLNLRENEYLIVWDKNSPTYDKKGNLTGYLVHDKFKFNGESVEKIKFRNIDNDTIGKLKPINVKQELAFDMLQDTRTTVKALFSPFGSGKDLLMISHAIDMLTKGKIDKIVWVRNNVEVANTSPIGFLPNSATEKLLPFAMPLVDHLGGMDLFNYYVQQEKIEIQHLGFLRGRDFKRTLIYCTEVQGNTKEHIELLLGRVGEGSQIWLNGDINQIDHDKFRVNNGVKTLKKLQGQELYGQVSMDKIERSKTARLADFLSKINL